MQALPKQGSGGLLVALCACGIVGKNRRTRETKELRLFEKLFNIAGSRYFCERFFRASC
jgi:hypothetical protein